MKEYADIICKIFFDRINPNMTVTSQMIRPDGDVELTQVNNITNN